MPRPSVQNFLSFFVALFALWKAYHYVNDSNEEPLVTLRFGTLRGQVRKHYLAFEGVPYAEPPVGENRFEPPKPYRSSWEGVRDALSAPPPCLQWNHFKFDEVDKVKGSENCLFLNIYTSDLKPSKKRPVVVYFHGGGFTFGQGHYYGPEILTTIPIVFINLNYRLGPLGFLSTESTLVPGNMGLKDQVMALRWIQENIEVFGGDPSNVILTGFSAGGASVHGHFMSPLSEGLFHKGISHSGCALNPWAFTENSLQKAQKVAATVGCTTGSNEEMIRCLKRKPGNEIVRTVRLFQPFLYNPYSPFGLVVEPKHEGAFLSEKPIDLIRNHKVRSLPWLVSATEAEGLYPAAEFMRKPEYMVEIEEHWEDYVASAVLDFNGTIAQERIPEVARKIREFYLGEGVQFKPENFRKLVKIVSDRLYKYGLSEALRLQFKDMPVYFYHFLFKTQYGDSEEMSLKPKNDFGVAHGEDIYSIYSVDEYRGSLRPYNEQELVVQRYLLDLYESFCYQGVPEMGDTYLPKVNNSLSLLHTEIRGPGQLLIKETVDYGEEKFWKSLGFNEN